MASKSVKTFSAPGKVILGGEHSVVYGYPAVVAAIDRWVKVSEREDGAPESDRTQEFIENVLQVFEKNVQKKVERKPLAVGGDLPLGKGLGGSAAVAKAVLLWASDQINVQLTEDELFNLVWQTETIAHGKSSGIDAAATVRGGALKFQKKNDSDVFFTTLNEQKLNTINWWLIDSGQPTETTKEMVSLVAQHLEREALFDQLGKATEELLSWLGRDELSPTWINHHHSVLTQLQVVSDSTQALISEIKKQGGFAKITGAGGWQTHSGMVLATHPKVGEFEKWLQEKNILSQQITLGTKV